MKSLSALDPPAYYMGYTITESQRAMCPVQTGRCSTATKRVTGGWRFRFERESTSWTIRTSRRRQQPSGGVTPVPIDDDAEVVRRAIWLETDKQYRAASEALIKIKTGKEIK